MSSSVSRMRRRALRKGHRQQRIPSGYVAPKAHAAQEGVQNIQMNWIACVVIKRAIHAGGVNFRPESPMHKPFLVPNCFQGPRRHLAEERRNVWPTKRAESHLGWISSVGVTVVERRTYPSQNQK